MELRGVDHRDDLSLPSGTPLRDSFLNLNYAPK